VSFRQACNFEVINSIAGDAAARDAIRQWLPDSTPRLTGMFTHRGEALEAVSWGDLLELNDADDQTMTDLTIRACESLTCWGSGRLNLDRCDEDQVLYLCKLLGRTSVLQQILRERTTEDGQSVPLEEQCRKLELRDGDRELVTRYLRDGSSCQGIIIESSGEAPEVFLVSSFTSGAYRSRTRSFRLR